MWQVKVFSGVGPVQGLVQEQFEFAAIGSYYNGFYSSDTQLGARPEATALVPPLSAPATAWDSNSRLSGCAAIGGNYKFDKEGKVFAAGQPLHGAIWEGAKVYDPRLDGTRPGGVGAHRIADDATWTYSVNPALHAGTYAYGWYEGTTLFYGIGVPDDAIDWAAVSAWANDCETNNWAISGVTVEDGTPENKIRNLDDISAAGGGRWLTASAVISFDWHRPRIALATITDADVLEAGGEILPLQSLRDRFNTVRPMFTSVLHNHEQITADAIIGTTYLAEDGQSLVQTLPLNLVKDAAQAGELASYALADSREIGPITLTLGPEWRNYRPGDTLRYVSEALNVDLILVITNRQFDPAALEVVLTFKSETAAKHAFALGKVATPPPTPIAGQTGEERDGTARDARAPLWDEITGDGLPEDNADVTAAVSGASLMLLDYSSADVLITPLPSSQIYALTARRGSALTSGVSWSAVVTQGTFSGTAPSITGSAQLSINSGLASPEAVIRVTATVAMLAYPPFLVTVRKVVAPAIPASVGAFASDSTFTAFGTTSFAAITDVLTVVLPAGGTAATLTASSLALRTEDTIAPAGATNCEFKWQRESSPGTWTDVGAVATSNPHPSVIEFFAADALTTDDPIEVNDPGSVTCNRSATGLGAGSTQSFRMVARVSGGNLRFITVAGTASVQG
jgi:hypothetical protein